MPITAAALKAIAEATLRGGTEPRAVIDTMISYAEAEERRDRDLRHEQAQADRELLKDKRHDAKIRQRRSRSRRRGLLDIDPGEDATLPNDVAAPDPVTLVTPVTRDPLFPQTPLSPDFDDEDGEARAETRAPPEDVLRLVDQVLEIVGIDRQCVPLKWQDAAAHLDEHMRYYGWTADIVLAGARRVVEIFSTRAQKHPDTVGYLTTVIKRAQRDARKQRQLPLVGAVAGKEVSRESKSKPSFAASRDAGRDAHAELKRVLAENGGGEGGGQVVGLLRTAGRR